MGVDVNPPVSPRRSQRLLALAAALLVGVALGVIADRVYLGGTQRPPDTRLVGDWVGEEGDISFRPDGTYEAAPVVTVEVNGDVSKSKDQPYTSQYRWVDRGTIEMYVPFFGQWLRQRLVFEGDQLTLVGTEGAVLRYTRARHQEGP